MKLENLTHEQKDDLISLTKKALELACQRLACYEGKDSSVANPEQWIGKAYLMTKTKGWEKNDKGI